MAEVHGSCDTAFDSVRDLFQQRIVDGPEVGASLCVNIDGKSVLDLWGGYADAEKTKPWDKNTITGIWSCTKIPTSLAAYLLIDRGLLDVNEKVAGYWPEFAANGKENVTVSQLLSHSSGVFAFDTPTTLEEMQDVEKSTQRLAQQAPWIAPGSQSAYQLTCHGHLVGALVQRITGKPLAQFIADEIAKPLGADFQIGLPEKDWSRTADVISFPPEAAAGLRNLDPTSLAARGFAGSLMIPTIHNEPVFRKSENGAIGGFSNARALVRIGDIVSLDGSVDGKQYLRPQTLDEVTRERVRGPDPCLMGNVRFALGFGLPWTDSILPIVPEEDGVSFWSGWGGSLVIMDRRRRITISYVMNQMELSVTSNSNFNLYLPEIYKAIERYTKQ
ncbi:uncharacterized protein PFLUO_LOCUS9073 [Penicillium psychrofluorescens]|uniref:uncharacterized protein n=1 Tax=Penicillium psychrofluorescens TaxID=3158075 RepID=UPI003CCD6AE3